MHRTTNGRRGGNHHGPQSVRPVVHGGRNAGRTPGRGVPRGGSTVAAASSTDVNVVAIGSITWQVIRARFVI